MSGATKVVAVWGHPVSHSRSPKMQNAAIQALGLDWVYVPFDVAPENLKDAVAGIRAMGLVGVNCTVPLKEEVGQFLDEIDPEAALAGSVNTIVNREGHLVGYSTDGSGLIWDLERQGVTIQRDTKVLIWGAGGSGRAIAHSLAARGCCLTIANRTKIRGDNLALSVGHGAESVGFGGGEYDDAVRKSDILINTTTLGMHGVGCPPIPSGTLHPGQVVYDIVYSPPETTLLEIARGNGCKVVSGLGMLACQGALSLALWAQIDRSTLPIDLMLRSISEN